MAGSGMARTRTIGASLWTALVVIPCACSDSPHPPCFGLAVGTKVALTLGVENLDAAGQMYAPCLDLAEGQGLQATVVDTLGSAPSDCTVGVPDFGSVNGWTWSEPEPGGQAVPDILAGNYQASRGACQGNLQLTLVAQVPDPLNAVDAGSTPSALFGFSFVASTPGVADCPATCGGEYAATIRKL
jgi:hypothetical protein